MFYKIMSFVGFISNLPIFIWPELDFHSNIYGLSKWFSMA